MTKTIFPLLAGAIPTQTLEDFSFSRSSEIALDDVSNIPDAPNIVTIKDDTDSFVTVIYNSLVGNVISELEYDAGDEEHIFPAGSYVSRCYTTYDHEALIEHTDTKVPSYQGIEVTGKLLAVGIDGYVTLVDQGKGTLDYNELSNKPMINSVPLIGNKTGADVGVVNIVEGSSLVPDEKVDAYDAHIIDVDNPHAVTKEQVGLGNVDNTADVDKPISDAVQEALDTKADVTDFDSHVEDTDNPHSVTKAQVGLGNADNTADLDKPISTLTQAALDLKATVADLESHVEDVDNPHSVTKSQVGLGNVDNTSDVNKPISTATQAALDLKADDADLTEHTSDTDNPHEVTASQVGLGNVDNTADLDKPISTLTQTALNAKVDKVEGKSLSENDYTDEDKAIVDAVTDNLATKVDKVTGMGLSQNSYTDAEKTKLAGIAAGAEVNVQADWTKTDTTDDSYIKNKPTALKNPYPVKFTGAVTSQYDGSAEVTVNIPDSATWGNINGNLTDQTDLVTKFGTKQDTIDSTHKLSADLVQETTTNKFNVQADWNATSGDAVILNKPSSLEPDSHASTHEEGGTDELELSESQITGLVQDLSEKAAQTSLDSHVEDTDNPHAVTKAQVGLPNVVDGAQINVIESISKNGTAQTIVNKNVNLELSKSDVGLGNVDNTSDATKAGTSGNPIHDAIETKAPISHASSDTTYGVASATNYGHPKATSSAPSNATLTAAVGTDNGQYARADHSHAKETFTMDGFTISKGTWVADSTYSNFLYKATISNSSISSSHIPIVILSNDDAVFGNVSKNAMTSNGSLTLYAKVAMPCVVSKVVFVKE